MATATVDEAVERELGTLSSSEEAIGTALGMRDAWQKGSGLEPREFSLVKIAALIALEAPPASYMWQVANALEAGVTPQEILGVLRAIAPQVGGPRVVAAAPEIMVALGLDLPDEG